ncbi:hypothetical protein [Thalassovita sp.]|uniref:hypothetical protein n=1 Tax=Thalassovita sp. TaxID=1979401 RepID=UPI0029DE5928|nr:hypothetical protein [Thalassovita sp.]
MTGPGLVTCQLPAWLLHLPDWIWPFIISDQCDGSAGAWLWLTLLFAHFGVGAAFGFLPRWFAFGFFLLWLVKELGADIPIAGWSGVVVLDSLIDMGAGALGFAVMAGRTAK